MENTVAGDDVGVRTTASDLVETVVKLISQFVFRTDVENHRALYQLCLCLASGVDLAITNKEVPSSCSHIPLLLKQVYKYKKDSSLEAAFVVLMISVKSACKIGWFSNKDADELELLTKEAVKGFSNPENVDIGPRCALPYLKNILVRCNPQMKMEKILVSLGIKCGFGAYVSDFNVAKDTITSQHEKICLFVIQMENVTRSDIVGSQINLMLNGRKVPKENKIHKGNGPQLVANVTEMLEDGVNLLQAVGKFYSSYVIALASTSIIPTSDNSELPDSNQQPAALATSGTKRYKTSWQISLKCPISRCRIISPVKGNLCKHLECFDLQSYLEVNLKEPSWRCPICKGPAGGKDLHVDQRFLKVLRESPLHVNDVIITKEGLWKPVPLEKDRLENNLSSDILQTTSVALGNVPVFSTDSSTARVNVKPNNAPMNIEPTHVPLQHHSTNQPNAVQNDHSFSREGSDDPKIFKPNVIPTQDNKAKRMRGSLTGQAYDAALSRLMSPPIQPCQAPPRPTLLPCHPIVVPVHLPQL